MAEYFDEILNKLDELLSYEIVVKDNPLYHGTTTTNDMIIRESNRKILTGHNFKYSIIKNLFERYEASILKVRSSGKYLRHTSQIDSIIKIPIKGNSVKLCLDEYYKLEQLENKIHETNNSSPMIEVNKQLVITKLPRYMIIQLQRFINSNATGISKIISDVNIDEEINMKDYTLESSNNNKYELISIGCHIGTNITSGHYIAYKKQFNNEWFEYNDAVSKKINPTTINSVHHIKKNAYILVYRHKEKTSPCPVTVNHVVGATDAKKIQDYKDKLQEKKDYIKEDLIHDRFIISKK